MTLPDYTPQPIVGYRFATNYGAASRGIDLLTLEDAAKACAKWLDVPVEDVLAIHFERPGNKYATFVKDIHAHKVEAKHQYLEFLQRQLEILNEIQQDFPEEY